MANEQVKIKDLPADVSISGTEAVPLTDAGVTKKATLNQLAEHAVATLMASTTTSSTTNGFFIMRDSGGAAKRISAADLVTALSATLVSIADDQTITGDKAFSGEVTVVAPTANMNPATKKYVDDGLATKVATVSGKALSANDFTNELKAKLEGIAAGAQVNAVTSVNASTGAVVLGASDVGAAAQTPTYTQAASLVAPTGSSETMEVILGKLWKAVTEEIAHIESTSVHVSAAEKSAWSGKQNAALVTAWQVAADNSHYPSEKLVKDSLEVKQDTSARVTSWSGLTADTNYPSEKLVKDSLDAKQNAALVTAWQTTPDNTHYPSEKLVSDSLAGFQTTANLRTSFQSTPDNTHYPSEKLVKDSLDAKQTTANLVTSWQTTVDNTHYPSEKLVSDEIDALEVSVALKQDTANLVTTVRSAASAEDTKYPSEKAVATAIAGGGMTIDPTPTGGSTNPVSSGGVYTALAQKQNTLTFDVNPTATSTNPCTSGGIKGALDAKGEKVTTWSALPSDANYPSEKLVKDTLDGMGGNTTFRTATITTGDLTIPLGSEKDVIVDLTDGRSSSGTVFAVKLNNTFAASTVQRVKIYISSAQAGQLDLRNAVKNSLGAVYLYVDGAVVSPAKLTTTTTGIYEIDETIINRDSSATVIIKVSTLVA